MNRPAPDRFALYDVEVRDLGFGPCVVTVGGDRQVVLSPSMDPWARRVGAAIVSTDVDGLLSREAARPVLEHIARLWNRNAAGLRKAEQEVA